MPPTAPQPLIDRLAQLFPNASRQTLRRMVQGLRVRVDGSVARRASEPVGADQKVTVADRAVATRGNEQRASADLDIVYEDADLLVVNKPPGLLTSTVPRERRPTLLAAVRRHVEQSGAGGRRAHRRGASPRVGLIHRLDRDASGLLVFSKSHAAYESLKRQFFEHTVERVYLAIVTGKPTPPAGRIESRLVERADGTVYSARMPGKGERAVTDYETVASREGRSLLRVTLHTGKKHQIRVHLSERGHPIEGDPLYAGRPVAGSRPPAPRLMLDAVRLAFVHPRTGKRIELQRGASAEFSKFFPCDLP